MNTLAHSFEDDFLATPRDMAAALARLEAEDAVSLPLLSEAARARLLAASDRLAYRPARPVIGKGEKAVLRNSRSA